MIRRGVASNAGAWIPSAIPFFLLGFTYYLVSPPFVYRFLSEDSDLLDAATRFFDPAYFDGIYFLDLAAILVSFLFGYFLARTLTKDKRSMVDYGSLQTIGPSIVAVSFGALILLFVVTARSSGASFFTGYSTYNILVLGPLSTCAFLSAWFVNYFSRKQIRLLFLSFFLICSVLLLGWGSRMFFVLSLMALMLGLVSRNKKLMKSVSFYSSVVVLVVFMMVVGIVRQGGTEFGADSLIAVLFAEPLFTSVSGSLYLEHSGGRPTSGVPHDLLAAIIHFIPSIVFPGKIELINAVTFDDNIESPFGAKALLVSLYTNFGMFYPVFTASIGAYYGFLSKKAKNSLFYRATYFSALPVLTFLFFREGISTVIKVLLFNGLLVPLFIALILAWLLRRPTGTRESDPTRDFRESVVQGSSASLAT